MSLLDRELREQPEAVQRLLDATDVDGLADALHREDLRYVLIAARGSSDNAARYAQYLFGVHHGLPVALATPSLISLYERAPRLDGALVLGVSQSGQSPDVVSVLQAAADQGRPVVAVTNDEASPLAQAATAVLPLHAGAERSVAATKTYTNSLAALALLSAALEEGTTRQERVAALAAVPAAMAATIDAAVEAGKAVTRYRYMQHCVVVGRGLNYSTAYEIALKLKELTGVIAEPYSPPDLLHGPIAAVDEGFPVVLVAPEEPSLASIRDLLEPLRERRAELIAISAAPELVEAAHTTFPLPEQPAGWLTPLVAVIPGQVMAARLAVERGADLDQPAGLTKVTETY